MDIRKVVEASLKRLRTARIDLWRMNEEQMKVVDQTT
jgi:aryl-alcohol dehydrogenase-like predicted oxidoreductase